VIQHRNIRGTVDTTRLSLVAASLALVVLGASTTDAGAQNDGTGGSSQATPGNCAIVVSSVDPALIANDTAVAESEPTATPLASPVSASASPVADNAATPAASPIASPVTAREASDPLLPLGEELLATTASVFACLNERTFDTFTKLTSDTYRGHLFGSDQPLSAEMFVGLAASLPESDYRVVALESVTMIDEVTVSAEVSYLSAFQQHTAIWTFSRLTVDGLVTWVVAGEQRIPISIPEGSSTINVVFEENGYRVTPSAVIGSDVVLNLNNPTAEDHEALILRFDDGVDASDLLQNTGAGLPEGVNLIGQATVLAGDEGTMFLTGLGSGTYTIVDLFPDENGIPHLSSGMIATFTVLF